MGIAITSGVLASLHSQSPLHGLKSGQPKWESHTPGTSTPTVAEGDDPTLPSRFIACVQREESAKRLRENFRAVLGGAAIEITVGKNVSAVQQSDVVLLWYARFIIIFGVLDNTSLPLMIISAANHRVHIPSLTRVGSKTPWLASCSSASLPASPSRNSPLGFFPAQQWSARCPT